MMKRQGTRPEARSIPLDGEANQVHVQRTALRSASVFEFNQQISKIKNEYLLVNDPDKFRGDLRNLFSKIRFVSIGGQSGSQLIEFIHSIFGPVNVYSVAHDKTHGFSSQNSAFSIIIALLDDVPRAKQALRQMKSVMDNKLCYAFMTVSNPKARAELLRFAFDDVFDTRMKPAEIIVRIQAHRGRQMDFDQPIQRDEAFQLFCDQNIEGRSLINQMPMLRQLYESMGQVVRYRELASFDLHSGSFRTKSVAVRIYHLRKKLKNYEIICVRGQGYSLVKRDG